MKLGRNDPCHCGSGRKYKNCCLPKDEEGRRIQRSVAVAKSVADKTPAQLPKPLEPPKPPEPKPVDPHIEALNARWDEFEAQDYEGQIALFLKTLEEPKLMDDEMAFEMLNTLYPKICERNEQGRYDTLVDQLRERLPKVYSKSAHYYLENRIANAVLAGRFERIPMLMNELAPRAGNDIDTFDNVAAQLAYHGQSSILLEAVSIAWPLVKKSRKILPWVIDEFATLAVQLLIFDYIEQRGADTAGHPELFERLKLYSEIETERITKFMALLTGQSGRQWTKSDFAFKPKSRKSREAYDDDDNTGTHIPKTIQQNLFDLSLEFQGYLRREENVPLTKGELARAEIVKYCLKRLDGKLEPRLSMVETAFNRPKPKTNPPEFYLGKDETALHWLCPDRSTFERHLVGMLHFLNTRHYDVAATFELMPAWLRFLESRQLIDATKRTQTLHELVGLQEDVLKLLESYKIDPALYAAVKKGFEKK